MPAVSYGVCRTVVRSSFLRKECCWVVSDFWRIVQHFKKEMVACTAQQVRARCLEMCIATFIHFWESTLHLLEGYLPLLKKWILYIRGTQEHSSSMHLLFFKLMIFHNQWSHNKNRELLVHGSFNIFSAELADSLSELLLNDSLVHLEVRSPTFFSLQLC